MSDKSYKGLIGIDWNFFKKICLCYYKKIIYFVLNFLFKTDANIFF